MSAKSFYIFDFDDNLINTESKTFLFHKKTKEPVALPTHEFITQRKRIGIEGPYKDYEVNLDRNGTFQRFYDNPEKNYYPFLEDLKTAVSKEGWKGPSWSRFLKALDRNRTMAIITARGNLPSSIKQGFEFLFNEKITPTMPDFRQIYSVTNDETKKLIGWDGPEDIAALKSHALSHFISEVYQDFGTIPEHRFGFSDDDPSNLVSTMEQFLDCKKKYPHHSFFLYEARPGQVTEKEVTLP